MRYLFLLLLMLFLASCRKPMVLMDVDSNPYFKGAESQIMDAQEDDWKVGNNRAKKVTKSVSFFVETPVIEKDDALQLASKFGIDSWVFRIVRLGKSDGEVGFFYIQFVTNKDRPEFLPVNRTMVQLNYAAAYMSERFRSFKCPAFGHRKRVVDLKMESNGVDQFVLQTFPRREINAKPDLSFINPARINAGNSLLGVYEVQIALFNSHTREYFGEFRTISNQILVQQETEVDIPECLGVKEENNPASSDRKGDFKFGH